MWAVIVNELDEIEDASVIIWYALGNFTTKEESYAYSSDSVQSVSLYGPMGSVKASLSVSDIQHQTFLLCHDTMLCKQAQI